MRGCVVHNHIWPWSISSRLFSHDFAIKLLKYCSSCCVLSTAHTVLDGFFPYLAKMITSMRGCVVCNDLWLWFKIAKSFPHDFAMKLLKYGSSCCIRCTVCTVLDGLFPYMAQMIISMRGCVAHNDLWPWPISSRSFSLAFAIKLLKYDGFFPYLAQMINSMRGYVAHNDFMPWPIHLRLFSSDVTYFIYYIHMWHQYNPCEEDMSHIISRSLGQKSRVDKSFLLLPSGQGVS